MGLVVVGVASEGEITHNTLYTHIIDTCNHIDNQISVPMLDKLELET